MRWQYKTALLFLLLSQLVFLGLAVYHTETGLYGTVWNSYAWIWYHIEDWSWSLVLALVAAAFFVSGTIAEAREKRGPESTNYEGHA